MTDTVEHTVTVGKTGSAGGGARLDKVLAQALPTLSRTRLKGLIIAGQVRSEGATISDPSAGVKPGQVLVVAVPPAVEAVPLAADMALDVVYEDSHLIVIDKPAGLVVHPAPGNPDRTLVNALLGHCGASLSGIGGVRRPGIVHRLDKDTSGLIVAAKNDAAHQSLAAQFASRSIERLYEAVVWGNPAPLAGEISGNIGRSPRNRKKMAVVAGGKAALTRYRVLERLGPASLIECRLASGRTHQIRVHLAHRGHPLVGDPLYGRGRRAAAKDLDAGTRAALAGFRRQALHARTLGFKHPAEDRTLSFERPPPADFAALLTALKRIS
jgi:23S rRNA pseudouridine1911/1915/1917 synthase